MCSFVLKASADDLRDRRVLDLDGLLEESVEEEAAVTRAAAVEAEGELVEVVVELLRADGALVGAEQPAFQKRGDPVHARVGCQNPGSACKSC